MKSKICKAQKKTLEKGDFVCVKVKNLDKKQIKNLKEAINSLCENFFKVDEEGVEEKIV